MMRYQLVLLFVYAHMSLSYADEDVHVIDAYFDCNYTAQTPNDGRLVIYRYTLERGDVVRVGLHSSDARRAHPLNVAVRYPNNVLAIQLPLVLVQNYTYNTVARTLYSADDVSPLPASHSVSVELTSLPGTSVSYTLIVRRLTTTVVE
ncbi:unnamed protein product [Sphagnum balticum]